MLVQLASMRDAYAEVLLELGEEDSRVVVLGADTSVSIKTSLFGDRYPERFFNVGVAEANMMGIAAGLALAGKIPFVTTYAAFVPGKCLDQIRNAIAYPNLNVKIVSSHGGLTVGPDGASHQTIEDVAAIRAIPRMHVVVPADAPSTKSLIAQACRTLGPFYIRLSRPSVPTIYSASKDVEVGKAKILREGSDIGIVACGIMVNEAMEAAETLSNTGVSAEVVDSHTVKPLDSETIVRVARKTGELVSEILQIVPGPVNLEVVSQNTDGMLLEAHNLASLSPNVVVKCPMTSAGLVAVKTLSKEGINTNVTLVFSPNQALLAAKAGATYVSPFIGRLDDAGHEGMKVIEDTLQIYRNYEIETQVLVASIRHPVHVVDAAKLGAHVATMPPDVLEKMVKHPLTDIGLKRFLDDWQKAGLKLPERGTLAAKARPLVQRA